MAQGNFPTCSGTFNEPMSAVRFQMGVGVRRGGGKKGREEHGEGHAE